MIIIRKWRGKIVLLKKSLNCNFRVLSYVEFNKFLTIILGQKHHFEEISQAFIRYWNKKRNIRGKFPKIKHVCLLISATSRQMVINEGMSNYIAKLHVTLAT